MSIPRGFLPVREEMSTSTRKRIKHVTRTPDTALGTLLLMALPPTSGGENTRPCINLAETDASDQPPPGDQDLLSANTCPFVVAHHWSPLPVGAPLRFPDLTLRAEMRLPEAWLVEAVSWHSGVPRVRQRTVLIELLLWGDWGLPVAQSPGVTLAPPLSPVSTVLWFLTTCFSTSLHRGLSERHLVPEMILNVQWLSFLLKHFQMSNIVWFATCMTMDSFPSYTKSVYKSMRATNQKVAKWLLVNKCHQTWKHPHTENKFKFK